MLYQLRYTPRPFLLLYVQVTVSLCGIFYDIAIQNTWKTFIKVNILILLGS